MIIQRLKVSLNVDGVIANVGDFVIQQDDGIKQVLTPGQFATQYPAMVQEHTWKKDLEDVFDLGDGAITAAEVRKALIAMLRFFKRRGFFD